MRKRLFSLAAVTAALLGALLIAIPRPAQSCYTAGRKFTPFGWLCGCESCDSDALACWNACSQGDYEDPSCDVGYCDPCKCGGSSGYSD